MCTVTLIARRQGYALGMNRDEKLARAKGLPPRELRVNGRRVVCPSEPGGGTWIALNDAGATFALINSYSITSHVEKNPVSRGEVVNAVRAAGSVEEAAAALAALPLQQINPFRLISVFPQRHEVIEWRWDLRRLQRERHPWQPGIWISSGHDEAGAQRSRAATFAAACRQVSCGSLDWLRRLHRSHRPERGPYSICMHRADAATVSHAEILVTSRTAAMRYISGVPCLRDFTALTPHRLRVRAAS